MYCFLILSFLSGIIELGSVYLGVNLGLPLHQIIALPLFYQIGNLMTNVLPKKESSGTIFVVGVGLLTAAYYLYSSFSILAIELIGSSYCIQLARARYKSTCPTWLKRSFRIGGFTLSPVMTFGNGQIVILFSMLFCLGLIFATTKFQKFEKSENAEHGKIGISSIMIFHQMHYFVYTYIMPIYVYQLTASAFLSSLAFSATWVIYLIPQTIAENLDCVNYKKMFFFCHLFLGLCMGVMAVSVYFHKTAIVLVAWLLTGLGGGSVFCISHLCKKYESLSMDFSENIGHFLGPLVAVVLCYIIEESAIVFLSSVSAIFVIIALTISLYIMRKEV